jgi:hypothetical protein
MQNITEQQVQPAHVNTTPPPDSEKDVYQLLEQAQRGLQNLVAEKRVDYLRALTKLQSIGGKDDLKLSIVKVVSAFPQGIAFTFLTQAIPDATVELRDELAKEGLIELKKSGRSAILKPVTPKSAAE